MIVEYKETVDGDCTLPILTSSKTEGVVLQEDHFGSKQRHDITGYNILPRGYCTYRNRSDGVDFTFNINKCCDKGIISKFYPVFYGNNNNIHFISLVLNHSDEVVHEIGYTCIGTGQKVLSFNDLQKMNIRIPCLQEQDRISKLFESIDNTVTLHQGKCFHDNNMVITAKIICNSTCFSNTWEQRKYSEIIDLLSGQDFEPSDYNENGQGIPYMTGASCVVDGKTIVNRWTTTPRCIAETGDVLLVCKGSGCGTIAVMTQDRAHIARQFMALKSRTELNNQFNY